MVRRLITNCQVTLATGYLLFFFSERLFWTVLKPDDRISDLVITWFAYSVLGCVLLNIVKRFKAHAVAICARRRYLWMAR